MAVDVVAGFCPQREALERELARLSIGLPVPQRAVWQQVDGLSDTRLFVLRANDSRPICAASADVSWSRALPGHRLYRVRRYAPALSGSADAELLGGFVDHVRGDPLSLRAVVEIFERNSEARERVAIALRGMGFRRSTTPRMYEQTLALDLSGTEAEVFARLNKTARQNVRAPAKKGFVLRAVTDAAFAGRLDELTLESFRRTNGVASRQPWARILELSGREPGLSRVVGLFQPDLTGLDSLVSFAWGCAHGSYVTYEAGGFARGVTNTPLTYSPLWDLVCWARERIGAQWFDLGGVSATAAGDARAGITRFKRYFSEQLIDVGEEWYYEPHQGRAMLARAISTTARWVQQRASGRL